MKFNECQHFYIICWSCLFVFMFDGFYVNTGTPVSGVGSVKVDQWWMAWRSLQPESWTTCGMLSRRPTQMRLGVISTQCWSEIMKWKLKGVMEGLEHKATPLTMSSLNIYNVKDNIEYQTLLNRAFSLYFNVLMMN